MYVNSEIEIAKYLDGNNYKWIRPPALEYFINGIKHFYFSDFYLPDYDIYLDPKNSFVMKKDTEKLIAVINKHKITIFYGNCEDIKHDIEYHINKK